MAKTIGLISANYTIENFSEAQAERGLAAMPFGGRYRLIDFPLSNMSASGVKSVGIIMPFNNRSLIDHVGTGAAWGFGRKTHSLFMLPGSVYGKRNNKGKFLLRDFMGNRRFLEYEDVENVIMTSCSRIFSMDFRPLIEEHEKSGANITRVYKGTEFMDCFVINREFFLNVLDWFSNLDFMDLNEIIDRYLPDTKTGRYEFTGYSRGIDDIKDYYRANMDLLDENVQHMLFDCGVTICTNIQDRCPTFYAPGAQVKNSLVAAGCVIEGKVENSIIFRSTVVEKGAAVKNCVLMQHAIIKKNSSVEYFICDKRVTVREGAVVHGSEENPCWAGKGEII